MCVDVCFCFLCRLEVSPTCLTKLNGAREEVGLSSYIIMYIFEFVLTLIYVGVFISIDACSIL